jgi:hypothetical protein
MKGIKCALEDVLYIPCTFRAILLLIDDVFTTHPNSTQDNTN